MSDIHRKVDEFCVASFIKVVGKDRMDIYATLQ